MLDQILIIDDDSRNIFALTATLKSKGFNVVAAADAEQGIAFVNNSQSIKLVLIDMMMPGMDGYEAIPQIKNKKPQMPVIAVTAQAMIGDKERCLAAGADDYISKPIDVDKLLAIVNRYLN